jgi:uncharacterized protein (TIGR00369 family)
MPLSAYLKKVVEPGQEVNQLFRFLGVEVESISAEEAALRLAVKKEHMQGAGVLAGGLIATLLDEAMAHVAIAAMLSLGAKEPGRSTATVDLNVRYLKPVRAGDTIRARAWILKPGKRLLNIEAEAANAKGELVAKASAAFIIL